MQPLTRRLVAFAVVFLISLSANAQSGKYLCSRAATYKQSPALYPDLPYRPYNVVSYDIKLDFRPAFTDKAPHLDGQETIDLILTDNSATIDLDAGGLHISDLAINGEFVSPIPQPDSNERLVIPLKSKFQAANTELTVNISWQKTNNNNQGLYFYPKGYFVGLGPPPAQDSVFVEEDLAYTMSEPRDAHYWLPCKDDPSDKADCAIRIWVPQGGIIATSNGTLSDSSLIGNYKVFSYVSDKPIATYLMCASASKFVTWDEKVARVWDPTDSIRLHYYAWQSDYDQDSITDGSKYNARNAFKNTKYMISDFEQRFGPYPFLQYGQVPVQPFDEGGMEHQTITTINRSWLRGWEENGIAHELGHQWFGDHVTCETFKDIWLNEGFATFCEAIYAESWGGNEWYMNTIRSKADGYFNGQFNTIPIYDPPENILFNEATTYDKPACVMHMLRRMVRNDTAFFSALRAYQDHFSYSNCNTLEFQQFMSAWLGIDLSDFFAEWIYGQLHPVYDIHWAQSDKNSVNLRVNQTQDARDHFIMPINFFAWHGGSVDTLRFQNDERSQFFSKPLPYKIDSLVFDDDALLLSRYTISYDAALGVKESSSNDEFDVRMDNSLIVIRSSGNGEISIYNLMGTQVGSLSAAANVNALFDASRLASGTYIVCFSSPQKKITRLIQMIR